jgi:hypothetical protein
MNQSCSSFPAPGGMKDATAATLLSFLYYNSKASAIRLAQPSCSASSTVLPADLVILRRSAARRC